MVVEDMGVSGMRKMVTSLLQLHKELKGMRCDGWDYADLWNESVVVMRKRYGLDERKVEVDACVDVKDVERLRSGFEDALRKGRVSYVAIGFYRVTKEEYECLERMFKEERKFVTGNYWDWDKFGCVVMLIGMSWLQFTKWYDEVLEKLIYLRVWI